jgi:hypothetical protein
MRNPPPWAAPEGIAEGQWAGVKKRLNSAAHQIEVREGRQTGQESGRGVQGSRSAHMMLGQLRDKVI